MHGHGESQLLTLRALQAAHDNNMNVTDLLVTTKTADLLADSIPSQDKRRVCSFKPAPRAKQRLRWRGHWLQIDVEPSQASYEGRLYGGAVTVT